MDRFLSWIAIQNVQNFAYEITLGLDTAKNMHHIKKIL